ncbi:hypothetical protein LTR10_018505 [Elasticomyces elasticus]|uniref:VOC domain-containing protein n=1 Tax=Exophiala sideris TaxID=1016849 RepID=A0ABR0J0N8_9EURO|nr:hypothetical protein LTR10_018505 [Elasticomyces elasticus]KAK5023902.1 hypothetical protein LTS07_009028 [Exophiala sideris]KAK5030081.1 hypothetical protein LTR13_008393 [Exophiala sideris]KAK5053576.1 hypothetical protein LTR69_009220 [Exophiala sideris]KAK5179381.1 hypothetical protein LTR44_008220 [Eurotiomycetes sp. CCFEE 6388]
MSTANPIPSPILGNITEICIVTPNIYTTIDGLSKTGIGPFQVFDFNAATVCEQELHGEQGTDLFRLNVAFAKQGSLVVEIMQPLPGGSGTKPSLMQAYLDENGGKAGVQQHRVGYGRCEVFHGGEGISDEGTRLRARDAGCLDGAEGNVSVCLL